MPDLDLVLDHEMLAWEPATVPPFEALVHRRTRRVRRRAAAGLVLAVAALAAGTSVPTVRSGEQVAGPLDTAGPEAAAWRALPDPGLTVDPHAGRPLASTGGRGPARVAVAEAPSAAAALVLRLVCVGPGVGQLLDADGEAFFQVACAPSAAEASAQLAATVPLTDRDMSGLQVEADGASTWRLSVRASDTDVAASTAGTWTVAPGVAAPPAQRLGRTDEFGTVRALAGAGGTLTAEIDRVDMLGGHRARAAAVARGDDPVGDYYLVNDHARVRIYQVSPSAVVWGSIGLTGAPEVARASLAEWIRFVRTPGARDPLFHLQTQDGVIVGIEEQYRP